MIIMSCPIHHTGDTYPTLALVLAVKKNSEDFLIHVLKSVFATELYNVDLVYNPRVVVLWWRRRAVSVPESLSHAGSWPSLNSPASSTKILRHDSSLSGKSCT